MPLFQQIAHRLIPFCLMTALAIVAAGESSPAQELVVTDKTVGVVDRNGTPIQSLPILGDEPNDDNQGFFAIVEDMDFDGCPDVRVLFSRGMVNLYYDCWLWRPEEKVFVRREDMRELSNPSFDHVAKRVHVYERGSAIAYVEGDLAWENGELVWVDQTVTDIADDGENVVIRRYHRDDGGELRLLGEEKRPLAENGGCESFEVETTDREYEAMDLIRYQPDLPGLNLFLELPGDTLAVAALANGEWWLRRGSPNRSLLTEQRRLPALEYHVETVERLIRREWPFARDVEIAPFPALVEKTSYPAFKAEFLDGENEDTRQFVAALIFADEWSFWFVLEASVDTSLDLVGITGLGDAAGLDQSSGTDVDNARQRADMAGLLLGVRAVEPANRDFLPDFGCPVYLAGTDFPLAVSVMDALVRIKKVVAPEDSPWIDPGRAAYRYDGPGAVAGQPSLLFSFGGDSREKFTAERHFAVDEEGMVYEMDVLAGGDYWKWEDAGTPWWGEYRRGKTRLRIQNYRGGPFGMYFIYGFTLGDESVAEGTALVRGRRGQEGQLIFYLANDDGSVAVVLDPEAPADSARDDLLPLEGVYKRQ